MFSVRIELTGNCASDSAVFMSSDVAAQRIEEQHAILCRCPDESLYSGRDGSGGGRHLGLWIGRGTAATLAMVTLLPIHAEGSVLTVVVYNSVEYRRSSR